MRLINAKTFKFEEFLDHEIPPYAILSHTWGNIGEELLFRDVQWGKVDKPGAGSVKLRGSCRQAEEDGYNYVWIDTCCIDKDSSAELDEAIRSMFRWYKRASVCYAYLSDVPSNDIPHEDESKFRSSRWFRRGWTLQELLAPESLQFYDSEWGSIGNKGGMSTIIGEITGVPQGFLLGIAELDTASVAQRMSWAAKRDTRRKEDLAYCLLGIFDVTMPIMYGEGGEQAFFRLQNQIMKKTSDDSILAWGLSDGKQSVNDSSQLTPGRILAATPSDFANSGHITRRDQPTTTIRSVSGSGGSLRLNISLLTGLTGNAIGLLNCGVEDDAEQVVGIPLATMSASPQDYFRPEGYSSALLYITPLSRPPAIIHVKNHSQSRNSEDQKKQYWLYNDHELAKVNLKLAEVAPRPCWHPRRSMIVSTSLRTDTASTQTLIRLRQNDDRSQDFVIVLGLPHQGTRTDARCSVMVCSRDLSLDELARKLPHVMGKASGRTRASNGLLHLHVKLAVDARQSIFTIKPETIPHPPSITVNATAELKKSELIPEIVQMIRKKERNRADARDKRIQLERAESKQQRIEEELRMIEETKIMLMEEKNNAARDIYHLKEEQIIIEETRDQISNQWSDVWERLEELYEMHENGKVYELERMDDLTPLRWAIENGHVEMVEFLLDKDVNAEAASQGGWPLPAAASVKDYGEIAQLLLAMSKANADSEDAIAQLLLDTGEMNVNSTDEDGRTPLSWAAERGHANIVRMLLEMDCTTKTEHVAVSKDK
ncbi:hypothetical protein F5Y14DRAFT_463023 [Nemania sp. NC0429]|nr:hypothetical protein F5Y14DRAFT_463023 [Nemania sp. NC0429]